MERERKKDRDEYHSYFNSLGQSREKIPSALVREGEESPITSGEKKAAVLAPCVRKRAGPKTLPLVAAICSAPSEKGGNAVLGYGGGGERGNGFAEEGGERGMTLMIWG